ncbi:MAG: hypothetical protein Q7S52_02250 [bacterium]|nr:hypothetical protein [bacterium]
MHNITQKQLIIGGVAVAALALLTYLFVGNYRLNIAKEQKQEQQAVLVAPGNTPDEAKSYWALVEKLAKESSTLTIGANCVMDPLVLKLGEGASVTLENIDTIPHKVAFEDGDTFILAPEYKKQIKLADAFSKTAGAHRYRCDDISTDKNVGVLYVVK